MAHQLKMAMVYSVLFGSVQFCSAPRSAMCYVLWYMVYGVVGCRFGSLEAAQIGGGVIEVVNQILCGNFWLNITSKFWTNVNV